MPLQTIDAADPLWWQKLNANFSALVEAPFPVASYADAAALATAKNPKKHKHCFALAGTLIYVSDGTSWVVYRELLTYIADLYIFVPEGTSFPVSSPFDYPQYGSCWNGTHIFCLENENASIQRVYSYAESGTPDISVSVSGVGSDYRDICWDGSNLWLADNSGSSLYRYTAAAVYDSFSFSASSNVVGVCFDTTDLQVLEGIGPQVIRTYTLAGVGGSSVSLSDTFDCIEYGDSHYWLTKRSDGFVYKYTTAGVYTGWRFKVDDLRSVAYISSSTLWALRHFNDVPESTLDNSLYEFEDMTVDVPAIKTAYNNLLADLRSKKWILT